MARRPGHPRVQARLRLSRANLMAARVLLALSGLDGGGGGAVSGLSVEQLRGRLCGNDAGMVAELMAALRNLQREQKAVRVPSGPDGIARFRLAPEFPCRKHRREPKRRGQQP